MTVVVCTPDNRFDCDCAPGRCSVHRSGRDECEYGEAEVWGESSGVAYDGIIFTPTDVRYTSGPICHCTSGSLPGSITVDVAVRGGRFISAATTAKYRRRRRGAFIATGYTDIDDKAFECTIRRWGMGLHCFRSVEGGQTLSQQNSPNPRSSA